eukprot:897086-Rhodomonas_salina.2
MSANGTCPSFAVRTSDASRCAADCIRQTIIAMGEQGNLWKLNSDARLEESSSAEAWRKRLFTLQGGVLTYISAKKSGVVNRYPTGSSVSRVKVG